MNAGYSDVDCGWRTGLGTCFYGRVAEARRLASILDQYVTVILIGPRNVGKSELARYMVSKVMGVRPLVIDARARMAFSTVQLPRFQDLASIVANAVAGRLGVKEVVDAAKRLATTVGLDKVLVIDEVHLLSTSPVGELEALVKILAFYPDYRGWKLVVTTSEGWVMASNLWDRVEGYAARIYTVKPIEETYARLLYSEYRGKHGCNITFETFFSLAGGVPGYLVELCRLERSELLEWVRGRLEALEEALETAPVERRRALETAYRLLVEGREASTKNDYMVAWHLVEHNIAYPVTRRRFEAQLRVYIKALRMLMEKDVRVNAHDLLEA